MPAASALLATGFGGPALRFLGTVSFSAVVIWLVIRILKED
jgi:hypothetical protein